MLLLVVVVVAIGIYVSLLLLLSLSNSTCGTCSALGDRRVRAHQEGCNQGGPPHYGTAKRVVIKWGRRVTGPSVRTVKRDRRVRGPPMKMSKRDRLVRGQQIR